MNILCNIMLLLITFIFIQLFKLMLFIPYIKQWPYLLKYSITLSGIFYISELFLISNLPLLASLNKLIHILSNPIELSTYGFSSFILILFLMVLL